MIGAGIDKLIQPNTKVVISGARLADLEVQDVDAIASVAEPARGADRQYPTPPTSPDHGCDLSIHAGTKYIVGHDAMIIISCATRQMFETAKTACQEFRRHAAPDDCYSAARVAHHGRAAAPSREERHRSRTQSAAEVDKVLHPALLRLPRPRQLEEVQGVWPVLLQLRDGYSKNALAAMLTA
jgi:cystathionine beta-lyase